MTIAAAARSYGETRGLAPSVERLHYGARPLCAEGRLTVRRRGGPIARVAGWSLGLPAPGRDLPVRVRVVGDGRREQWQRTIGGHALDTDFMFGEQGRMSERFGVTEIVFATRHEGGRLLMRGVATRIGVGRLRIALPRMMSLRVTGRAWATDDGEGVAMSVVVMAPVIGLLLAYRGRVKVVA